VISLLPLFARVAFSTDHLAVALVLTSKGRKSSYLYFYCTFSVVRGPLLY
jgi:hypothetical protein